MPENVEIERKFLISALPQDALLLPGVLIEQGYLNTDKERTTRIRVASSGEAYLTVKGVAHGATRVEIETPIDPKAARNMLSMVDGSVVSKVRRRLDFGGHVWEIDEFLGENQGLFVAEIELSSESEFFERPAWLGLEVTEDSRYANSNLALNPFRRWSVSARAVIGRA
jgi:CYTH domain-containing protein